MPRPVRRPTPITLPHCPMDTLWEVDETLEQPHMRSVFEDDDISFPLPPRSLPPIRRFFSKMTTRSPPKPTRAPPPAPRPVSPAILVTRPVSPSSSASSSDTEPPRTPPAASAPLPAYILAPPPPAEWESAIDELFEMDDQEEEIKWSPSPQPIRSTDSYLSFSPPCSPRMTYMHPAKSPLPACMSVYASDSLPMSPTFNRPLASPGLLPTSPTSPALPRWPTVPFRSAVPLRPARSSRRMGIIPVRIES